MDNLYIIIPAYNEDMNIEDVVKEWHEVIERVGGVESKLVVIDDGSKDVTYQTICNLKNNLPFLEPITKSNSGHGATVLFGYYYALKNNADYIFQTDSDGQTLPSEFYQFWELREKYHAIFGYRNQRKDGKSRIFVTKVLKFVLFCIFGLTIIDANTPFRLMKREVLAKYINKIPKDFNLSNVMLSVLLVKGRANIKFLPITFRQRQGGVNSINYKKIVKIGIQAINDFRKIKIEIE